jgi:quercetin dioxygenase-like cupin family protein
LVLSAVVTPVAGVALAADPLEVAPDMYTLQFENERVRVMQVTFQPGQAIPEHTHPSDHFVYVLEGGQLTITKADGTASNVDLAVGDVVWMPAETHSAVNGGTSVVRLLVAELK